MPNEDAGTGSTACSGADAYRIGLMTLPDANHKHFWSRKTTYISYQALPIAADELLHSTSDDVFVRVQITFVMSQRAVPF